MIVLPLREPVLTRLQPCPRSPLVLWRRELIGKGGTDDEAGLGPAWEAPFPTQGSAKFCALKWRPIKPLMSLSALFRGLFVVDRQSQPPLVRFSLLSNFLLTRDRVNPPLRTIKPEAPPIWNVHGPPILFLDYYRNCFPLLELVAGCMELCNFP